MHLVKTSCRRFDKAMRLPTPASSRLRRAGLPIGPTLVGIVLGVGTNFLFEGLKGPISYVDIVSAVFCFGLALVTYLLHFIFVNERNVRREDFARAQIRYALRALLVNADASLSAASGIDLNIRYYRHKNVNGSDRLYQDKEIHSLNVMRSSEEPFTYIDVTEKNMVMGQSFVARSHKFVHLVPGSFDSDYSEHAKKALDPEQKWILALPVLPIQIDGTVADDEKPYGIIAIYSNQEFPGNSPKMADDFVYLALQSARSFASILSLGKTLDIA
jgi:hypothetical protein